MASTRQQLETYLTNILKFITVANGYNFNIADRVYPYMKDINSVKAGDSLPAIYFDFHPETSEQDLQDGNAYMNSLYDQRYNLKNAHKWTLEVLIVGFVNKAGDNGPTNGNKLLDDITNCLHNYKPDAVANTLYSINNVTDVSIGQRDKIVKSNIEAVGVLLNIEYNENKNTIAQSDTIPSAPTITLPANLGTVTTLQPNIEWDNVSTAVRYQVQIATDSAFNSININQDFLTISGYTVPTDSILTNSTVYYTRVRAYNNVGYSNWSSTISFTTNSTAIVEKDWNELSGSNGWWNSYSATGIIISSGVSALRDQIGSRNLTQATSSRRPSLSGNVYNSLSSICFNPTFASESDILSFNDSVSAFKWGNSTSGSMILVMQSDGTNFDLNSGYFCPIARSNTSFGNEFSLYRGVNSGPAGYNLGYPYASGDYAIIPIGLNQPQHIIITHSSNSSILYLNGAKIGQLTKAFTNFATEANSYLVLGGYYEPAVNYASGRYTGHIFEAGFNTTVLTQAQVTQSYYKFKTRFGLS